MARHLQLSEGGLCHDHHQTLVTKLSDPIGIERHDTASSEVLAAARDSQEQVQDLSARRRSRRGRGLGPAPHTCSNKTSRHKSGPEDHKPGAPFLRPQQELWPASLGDVPAANRTVTNYTLSPSGVQRRPHDLKKAQTDPKCDQVDGHLQEDRPDRHKATTLPSSLSLLPHQPPVKQNKAKPPQESPWWTGR